MEKLVMKLKFFIMFFIFLSTNTAIICGDVVLSADTSHPDNSVYTVGEPVAIEINGTGLSPNDNDTKLRIKIVDEHNSMIEEKEIPIVIDTNGKFKTILQAPNKRLGFYRVYISLSNAITIPMFVSRPAGYITYCIVNEPKKRKCYGEADSFFGLRGMGRGAGMLPYLGARWVGGGYNWNYLEPDYPGQFSAEKAKADDQNKQKVSLSLNKEELWEVYDIPELFLGPNKWKTLPYVPGTYAGHTGALTPEGEKYWRNFCKEVGKAYSQKYPNRQKHTYEITWEPVYPWGFKGSDEGLIRIYEIAYSALHEVDPKAFVLGPCASNIDSDMAMMQSLMKKGLYKYLDGVSIHPYISMPPEYYELPQKIRQLKDMLKKYSNKVLPLYGTEQGYATGCKTSNEIIQAQGLIRANLIMLGEGFAVNSIFYWHDYKAEPGYGMFYNLDPEHNWGPRKTAPKPIVPAYSAMTFLLDGKKAVDTIDWLGDTVLGYAYQHDDDIVLALWDYGDSPRSISIPVGVDEVRCYDWMGNAKKVKTDNGMLKLELTKEPVYVADVSPKLWSSNAQKPVNMTTRQIDTYPGSSVTIDGNINAKPDEPLLGTLKCKVEFPLAARNIIEKPISVAAGRSEEFKYTFELPVNIAPGNYPVLLILSQNKIPTAAIGCVVCVHSPVTIDNVVPFAKDGKIGIKIKLDEIQNIQSSGMLNVRIKGVPESDKNIEYHLLPKSSEVIEVAYDNLDVSPDQTYPADIVLTTGSGYKFTNTINVNFLVAGKMTVKPKIDADLAEWKSVKSVELKGLDHIERSPEYYHGNEDLQALLKFSWDETAFYIAAEVSDDVYSQKFTGFDTWKGDCIQIGIDLDARKKETLSGNNLADMANRHRYTEIDLACTEKGPEAYRTISFDAEKLPVGQIDPKDICLAVKRNGKKTIYEAAIPWKVLGCAHTPESGFIGIAVSVNDSDDAGPLEPSAIGIFPLKECEKFGILILESQHK